MSILLGNISITDIKYIMGSYKHSFLWNICFQFVSIVCSKQSVDNGQDLYLVFDVRLESLFEFTVAKLIAIKTHYIWVADE